MRLFFTALLASLSLLGTFFPTGVLAGSADNPTTKEIFPGCVLDTAKESVLINGQVSTGGFKCYLYAFLSQNMVYVILIAIVLIVYSGVEYMYSVGNPTTQTKAKTRILGIMGGLIFYFLIQYGTRITSSSLKL